MWGCCPIRRPSSTFMPFQCWSISSTLRDQQHHKKITWHRWPSLHSRTSWPRSWRRQKTRWSDFISIQRWQGIGLGCHLYWLVLSQQPILHHSEPRFSVKRGRGLEEMKISSTCGRLWVCSSGCWNIRDHRFSRMLPFSWYRPPHFEGHQWSPPDVLHLSTDFSCHHPRQRPGYYSLIKEICPGVGWETLTVKMEMHCYVYITLISCIRNKKVFKKNPQKTLLILHYKQSIHYLILLITYLFYITNNQYIIWFFQ